MGANRNNNVEDVVQQRVDTFFAVKKSATNEECKEAQLILTQLGGVHHTIMDEFTNNTNLNADADSNTMTRPGC